MAKETFRKEISQVHRLANNRGSGISLGTWASTAVSDAKDPMLDREAMRILTIEFPGYKRPVDYKDVNQKDYFNRQVEVYALAIEKIFLREYFVEEDGADKTSVAATMK